MGNDNQINDLTLEKKVELIFQDLYDSCEGLYLETTDMFPSFRSINKEHAIFVLLIGSIFQLFNLLIHQKFPVEYYKLILNEIKKVGNLKYPNFYIRVDEFLKGVVPIKQDLENKFKVFSDDHLYSLQFSAGYLMFCNLFSRYPSMESEDEIKQITHLATKSFEKVIHYWGGNQKLFFS